MIAMVRKSLPSWCALEGEATVSSALTTIRSQRFGFLLVDPSLFRVDVTMTLLSAATDVGVASSLYVEIDKDSAMRIAQIVRIVQCELIGVGSQDEALLFEQWLRSAQRVSAPSLLAGKLSTIFLGFAAHVRPAIVSLFSGRPIPRDVKSLASQANSSERALERTCHSRGITTPGRLLVGAKVARTWRPITTGIPIEQIASRGGWSTSDQFRSHFRRMILDSPTGARKRMHTPEFADRLEESLRATE